MVREGMEKYLLRKSFDGELPDELLWRRKDGFIRYGVSKNERPWYEIIDEIAKKNGFNNEKHMYSEIFKKYYETSYDIIPYEWMPKWVDDVGAIDNINIRRLKIFVYIYI